MHATIRSYHGVDEKLDSAMPNQPKITSGKVVARSIEHALVS